MSYRDSCLAYFIILRANNLITDDEFKEQVEQLYGRYEEEEKE